MTTLPQATMQPSGTVHSLRAALVCVGAGALASAILFFENAHVYLLFFALLACLLLPMWIAWYHKRLDWFEPVHVFGLVYFLYFGLGGIWTLQDPRNVAYDWNVVEYIPSAMLYALIGHLTFLAGYYLPWRKRGRAFSGPSDSVRGGLLLAVCGLLGVAAYGAQIIVSRQMVQGRLPVFFTSMTQLRMFFLFAWSLAWLLFFARAITRLQRWILLLLLVPGAIVIGYMTVSNKSLIMTLAVLPVVAMWYTRRRIPWKSVVIILLVSVFAIFPFYNTYRNTGEDHTRGARIEQTYYKLGKSSVDDYIAASLTMFKTRLAMVNSLGVVIRDVPRWVPYARGRTIILPTLALLVPRAIWPDKPVFYLGREFGDTFRITGSMDKETNIAVTLPGEFYWNFALPGIVLGMALVGCILRFVYRRYGEGREGDLVARAILMTLLVTIAFLGGSVAFDGGELVRTALVMEALRWLSRYCGLIQRGVAPGSGSGEPRTPYASDRILSLPG